MSIFLVVATLTIAVLIGIGLYRVWIGPTVFDRLVAVALVSVNGVIMLVLLGVILERPVLFFDIALGFALLAFLLPITLGRYFEAQINRREQGRIEPAQPQHTVPHTRLADRGRELERRYATRLQRQASDANVSTTAWREGSGRTPGAGTADDPATPAAGSDPATSADGASPPPASGTPGEEGPR